MASWRRLAPLLAVLVVAGLAVVVAAKDGDRDAPTSVRDSKCYNCHSSDNPKLQVMGALKAAQVPASGAVGTDFPYPLEIANGWKGDLKGVTATLDLTNAPSLSFGGGFAPVDETTPGAIAINPADPLALQFTDVPIIVNSGATHLKLTLTPGTGQTDANTGVDLRMLLFPGGDTSQPPKAIVDAAGRGQAEVFELSTAEAFAEFGDGNWTVRAAYAIVDEDGGGAMLPSTSVPFSLHMEATQDLSGTRTFPQGTLTLIPKNRSTLFTYPLHPLAEPAAGETVTVSLVTWGYYDHDGVPTDQKPDDWNFTETYTLEVKMEGGMVQLVPPAGFKPPQLVGTPITLDRISEVVGYVAAFLLVSSIWSGGMFGKASRRQLNVLFASARRRVAFHNVLSYAIIAASLAHMVLFFVETLYHWAWGLVWGGLAILGMLGLGVTGAIQVPMIRRTSYGAWRWTHWGMTVATIVFTLVHIFLEGGNFADIQAKLHWTQPLVPSKFQG